MNLNRALKINFTRALLERFFQSFSNFSIASRGNLNPDLDLDHKLENFQLQYLTVFFFLTKNLVETPKLTDIL